MISRLKHNDGESDGEVLVILFDLVNIFLLCESNKQDKSMVYCFLDSLGILL